MVLLLLVSVLILGGTWFYTTWSSGQDVLPPTLSINGIPMGGMTRDQALSAIEQAYTLPITVTYAGEVLPPLLPEIIELRTDTDATAENLDEALAGGEDNLAFVRYLIASLRQEPLETTDVSAVVLYSRDRVNAFLERTAQKYDHGPMAPVALPESGTFRPAMEGTTLNTDASLPLLISAILAADPADRQVDLVVETTPAPDASIDILEQALATTLSGLNGVSGIFAKDLTTGQELCINCDVAFAGLSTMKIAIALEYYRAQEAPLSTEMASLMNNMLVESDNSAANELLSEIGASEPYSGAQQVTDFLQSLGLENTFLAAPYDLASDQPPPEIVTEANARTDMTTNPDPYIQTTPLEMGVLLESLYQCSQGGGCLRALYPRAVTPAKCQELIAWMEQDPESSLLGGGMPIGTRVAHKHGFGGETHADIAIVYGPRTDFVLAAFLYQPEWLAREDSVPTFAAIGQLTYRFFDGDPMALASGTTP